MKYPWQRLSDGNKNWQPYLGTRVAPSDADPSTRPGSRIAKPKPIKVGRVNTAGVFRLHSLRDSVDAGSVSTGASDDEPPKVDADATQEHRFDSFHVLELKADVASNERAEFNAIACSSCGSLLVAAGFLYRKGAIVFRPGTTENGLRGQGLASAQTPLVKDKVSSLELPFPTPFVPPR